MSCGPIPKEDTDGSDNSSVSSTSEKADTLVNKTITVAESTNIYVSVKDKQEEQSIDSAFESSYYHALNNLYRNNDYTRAIEVFRTLRDQYPMNELTDNCQFWIGVSLYQMGKYEKALIELEKVDSYYPDSRKKQDTEKWIKRTKRKIEQGQ